jgi:hypothetical protein
MGNLGDEKRYLYVSMLIPFGRNTTSPFATEIPSLIERNRIYKKGYTHKREINKRIVLLTVSKTATFLLMDTLPRY